MEVTQIPVQPFYMSEKGLLVYRIDDESVPVPFGVGYKSLIYLPPGSVGGNHTHQRQEAFLGSEHLVFVWMDSKGNTHRENMVQQGVPMLFVVAPHVPHAVLNTSSHEQATLFEFADDPILNSSPVKLV